MSKFVLKCSNCRWYKFCNGRSDELSDLKEVVRSCKNCGKPREFKCPECKLNAKLLRVKK